MVKDPLPSGDLAEDIKAFTNLEECIRARASDPVLAEAIDALGYDTLARDACRVLEAIKLKDKQRCKPITSSQLRNRCESNVAILVGDPSLCPLLGLSKGDFRDPLCLARASRDERLCAALVPFRRPACKAMVTGRVDDCHGDESCVRQIDRWKALLEKPTLRDPFVARIRVEITPDKGTPEPSRRAFDLDDDAAGGAVVRISGDRMRLSIGSTKTPYWPSSDAGYARPKLYLEIAALRGALKKERHNLSTTDLTVDVLLPKVGTFSALTSDERTLEASRWADQVGQQVNFTITTKLGDAPHTYGAKIEVETFVRDVVEPTTASEQRP